MSAAADFNVIQSACLSVTILNLDIYRPVQCNTPGVALWVCCEVQQLLMRDLDK